MNAPTARWLTRGLAAVCGALALLAVVQQFGFGRAYGWLSGAGSESQPIDVGTIESEPFKLEPLAEYSETQLRPLFNEDRKPTPITEPITGPDPSLPQTPLNVTLTGIIVSPSMRLVTLRDNMTSQSLALREGMPLEGEQGGWQVLEIKPRSVVFDGAGLGQQELELVVSGRAAGAAPGPQFPQLQGMVVPDQSGVEPGARYVPPGGKEMTPDQRAEEIRRKIEDRRRQMREEAERLKQEQKR